MSVEILDVVALSPLQRGLYSVSSISSGVDPYLVTFAARIENLTDLAALRRAFGRLLERYPHLGGAVLAEDVPHPVLVITSAGEIGWREVDLRAAADPDEAARQLYWDEARRRLDLERGPLFRVVSARVGETAYELICTAHHIVVDGWSIPLLFADLIALHRGDGDTLAPAPPLRVHAAWLASRNTEESRRAWAAALAGLAPMPMIGPPAPADIDLPVVGEARLDPRATAALQSWARGRGLTLNTVLQMAWARILAGLTGRDDVVFGQTTSGRDASLPEAERLVGALVTTIPVRVVVDERDPASAGARLQREVAQLRAHEYLGIAEITRVAGAGQLFDTLLVFENSPIGSVTAEMPMGGGASLRPRRVDSPSHYPLAVVPVVEQGELICRVETRPDLVAIFDPDRMARRVLAVAQRIVAARRCCEVDILLDDEPAILADPQGREAITARSVPQVLLEAAARTADRTAVVDAIGRQSFEEFGLAVRTLAAELRTAGVRPGDAVAVLLPRDRRVLHAPFAIGHAGALCVHVDPATPADRVAYMLTTAGARIVLADAGQADVLGEVRAQGVDCVHAIPADDGRLRFAQPLESEPADVAAQPNPQAPFYVVFTSGTTGRPKGVAVSHGALLNHWANHERRFFAPTSAALGRQLRIGHGWSTGFDAAWQPTAALLSGHTVVLLGDEVRTDAERIVAAIAEYGIDIFDTSPSMLNRLIAAGLFQRQDGVERCPLAVLALGGEAIVPDTWRRLQGLPTTRVVNFYGPTETTVEALMADVHDHPAPTIGRPFDKMRAEVLDHRLRPVPAGGQGELYLSGPQLALGYLGRPGTTAAAFVAGPGGRRYRTGDLVRRNADGTVAYEGRIDDQVKINGYRVEPDEVTVVLRGLDGVRHAAALAFTENGRTRLGALVVADRPPAWIRSELARRLPRFLVPTRIAQVDEIPLNRNDKLDVHAAAALLARPVETTAAEPETDTERALLAVVEAVGGGRVGILDSLTDLGIDSIGVIDLVSRLRGAGYRVAAGDVLAAADLRDLARLLAESDAAADEPAAELVPAGTVLALTDLAREIVADGDYRYLAQSQAISLPPEVSASEIVDRLEALATAHPTLRSRLGIDDAGTPVLIVGERSSASELLVTADDSRDAAAWLADTVERLDPESGRMIAATVLDGPNPRLLLSIHHLAVDVVSWLILLDDLRRLEQGQPPLNETPVGTPPPATDSGRPPTLGRPIRGRLTDPAADRAGKAIARRVELGADHTERLLAACAESGVRLEDALLLACAHVVADTADADGRIPVTRESHGRAERDADTRRVGWFTVEETVLVPTAAIADWAPSAGRPPVTDRTLHARGQIRLNHLGRFDLLRLEAGPWSPVPLSEFTSEFGVAAHPELPLRFTIDVNTAVVPRDSRPRLVAQFDVNSAVLDEAEVRTRTDRWLTALSGFAEGRAELGGKNS
ncbi:amino acid adenylation domain-containing protein [Nocardia sp. CDC159]|uniref:Amino acid adenylation domain-containing protein n=1 Tax=Nocardia pulmonis TaxID=2951408 RepID=A0A9X2E9D6_9NOCA|nr:MULTISPECIES: amino acid adenylation domain-containing protein [Nocardia]MCM6776030.1 amino acid adenylation domain-containing protein [Nocardia pulmonis]MCM6788643.1 amino acid adenylation domain-containing protein [Nocardia sp. CDC159]